MNDAPAIDLVADRFAALRESVGRVVIDQEEALRLAWITLLSAGHGLVEGVPGVAKTLLVQTLARAVDLRFGRVQFTPDLMPSDVVGTVILGHGAEVVRFRPGPIFTDLLLADEINRAPAKTQAALLEAMQERHVTVDGTGHALGPHFTVFATQNPVEHEGTYPLPEAELDRFLFRITMAYPSAAAEREVLLRHHAGDLGPAAADVVVDGATLDRCRAAVGAVITRDEIVDYVVAVARATREDRRFTLGASPRAALMLLRAAKAAAAIDGRDFVVPDDVRGLAVPVLAHRVQLDPAAEIDGLEAGEAVLRVLAGVPVPR
jgi:MoxR-like ATPase